MYINFKKIKDNLEVDSVINYFNLDGLTKKYGSYHGSCPIHKGDNSNAFHFSIEKKIFNCFTSCGGGNILDFISMYCNVPIYEAGKIGLKIINGGISTNNNLKFPLNYNPYHIYLLNRDISQDTIKFFAIGYCEIGYWKNRILIPIHNIAGDLISHAARSIDGSEPRYLFPAFFNKSDHIYNMHRISEKDDIVYIVEGFFDVFRLHNFNVKAISIMGTSLSRNQMNLLKSINTRYLLMMDGDIRGKAATSQIMKYMHDEKLDVSVVNLKDNTDPADLDKETFSIYR